MQPVLRTRQPARHSRPLVKAGSLAHVIFERPDLQLAERFLTDFGLVVARKTPEALYLRAAGPAAYCYRVHRAKSPRFAGFGVTVASEADLRRLAELPGASNIEASPHPGGGRFTKLEDPSGFTVEAVHGRSDAGKLPYRPPLNLNQGMQPTRINTTQRPPVGPPGIYKLGHIVLEVADYQKTCEWYTYHLGLIPSDVQVLPDGSPVVTFMRLDLGDTPADHHSVAIAQGFAPGYGHSAYEVVDTDAIGMGQKVLRDRGWKHAWGIGRHILGSQIFDYWQDPWGDKHEHYCDGDMFTADKEMGVEFGSRDAMAQWGQRMPAGVARPKLKFETVSGLIRSLRHSPDVTLKKIVTILKLFAA
jgi:catechol 2,3-dioxygenase-like lactoylglutathione lyase family enzyme